MSDAGWNVVDLIGGCRLGVGTADKTDCRLPGSRASC